MVSLESSPHTPNTTFPIWWTAEDLWWVSWTTRTKPSFPGLWVPSQAGCGLGEYFLWNLISLSTFPPFFFLLVALLCPAVSLFPSHPAVFGKDLMFPWCAQVGICSWSPLSVTESNLLNEIIYVPTLCPRQTCEHYLSSVFIPEEPRLKLLFCEMEHSHS